MNISRLRKIEKALIPKPGEGIAFISHKIDRVIINFGTDSKEMTVKEYEAALENGKFKVAVSFTEDFEEE